MNNNRYKYYRLGQDAQNAKKSLEAIEHYISYSTYLKEEDKHIPFLWIHNILFDLEKHEEAKSHLLTYCKGCSYPHAAKTLKEKARIYKEVGLNEISIELINQAKEYQKLQKATLE